MRLHQAGKSELRILFLILLAVSLRAELASSTKLLQQRQFVAAVQTPHALLIGSGAQILNTPRRNSSGESFRVNETLSLKLMP
jgi:hypothetical protein